MMLSAGRSVRGAAHRHLRVSDLSDNGTEIGSLSALLAPVTATRMIMMERMG